MMISLTSTSPTMMKTTSRKGKEYMAESTTANETYQPMTFDAIKIGLASPEKIREWSRGEVLKPILEIRQGAGYLACIIRS